MSSSFPIVCVGAKGFHEAFPATSVRCKPLHLPPRPSFSLCLIKPCGPLKVNRHFEGTYHLHLQGRRISRPRSSKSPSCHLFSRWFILKTHYHVHSSMVSNCILNLVNPVHTTTHSYYIPHLCLVSLENIASFKYVSCVFGTSRDKSTFLILHK
jgi:hypothetical protein